MTKNNKSQAQIDDPYFLLVARINALCGIRYALEHGDKTEAQKLIKILKNELDMKYDEGELERCASEKFDYKEYDKLKKEMKG